MDGSMSRDNMPAIQARAYDADVCVAGGGPAGLAAAIACAQRGLSVIVVDAARPPLDKACGEGLMPNALDALAGLGIAIDATETAPFAGICFTGLGQRAEACFTNGSGYGIRRTLLHDLLHARAKELEVRLEWGTRIIGMEGDVLTLDGRSIHARWIVGADGLQSRVRQWAGLDHGRLLSRRIGLRRHYAVTPWSRFVEIYWAEHGQAYVTPISPDEVCVAFIAQQKPVSFEAALAELPELQERIAGAPYTSATRGALTLGRRLRRLTHGPVALIGDASGSVDSITGEGLASGFRQAISLADAVAANDLSTYERASREISRVPFFMSQTMLLMDRSALLRRHVLAAFARSPQLFSRMLQVHVEESPLQWLGGAGVLHLGWQLLTA
jgi:flavin-dependent dehydrogenase